jgi:RNA polymerase sigma-70 factor, ECF subfamily
MIIDRLPTLQQAVLKMKEIEQYELEEIAAITGTTNEAVRVNLSRARKKVREEFIRLTGPRQ